MYATPERIAEVIAILPAYVRVEIPTTAVSTYDDAGGNRHYTQTTITGTTRDLPRLGRRITTDKGFEFFADVETLTRVEAIGLTVKEFTL